MTTREQTVAAWKRLLSAQPKADEFRRGVVSSVDGDGTVWVTLNGDDQPSPCVPEIKCLRGDRVTVRVTQTGRAYVSANDSDPGVNGKVVDMATSGLTLQIDTLRSDLVQTNEVVATKVDAEELEAEVARLDLFEAEDVAISGRLTAAEGSITNLQAQDVAISGRLTAAEGSITSLEAQDVAISGRLTAAEGNITSLQAQDVSISGRLTAAEGQIGDLEATALTADSATITDLQAQTAKVENVTAGQIEAATGYVGDLQTANVTAQNIAADHATVGSISTTYARIDAANITDVTAQNAWVDKILVQTGLIANSGTVFTLDAIQVNAANITAGTLDVERLIVTVDGEKYMVHVNAQGTPSYEKLDGGIIGDHTIAADKLVAHSITASEITTQNLVGTGGWINLANGTFGYYNGSSFAQAPSGITWDGAHLKIKAESLVFESGTDVETAVSGAVSDASTALQTALDGAFLQITSTNGNLFKNGAESTILQVAVFPNGGDRCDTLAQVRSRFGSAAYIEWKWMHESDGEWGTLLSTDSHLSHDGMWCTVTPADVATKTSFSASLVVPGEGD